ncbi:odorant receptor 131-2 [Osmerus mordax]|uniref:odorant receptor 131-2 n=1 Tax=Osmerus mordax TaxID=8014 RepID=UPI00350F9CD9
MLINNGTHFQAYDFTYVRFCVSTVSFSILASFNIIINWTIVREERLRSHARFVLVFHLLVSALVYFGMSSVFYLQIYMGSKPAVTTCMAMITVLIASASNILITLTAMALDRYFAVCHPMRYSPVCCGRQWPWLVGLLTWGLALVIPLCLILTEKHATKRNEECGRERLIRGELQKIVLISVCAALILYSYVRILVEGQRLGVLNRRNRVGCRTIALHGTQLAVYILPNFVNFGLAQFMKNGYFHPGTKELSAVVVFAFFSLAQCVAPIVYGLRKEELLEQVHYRFPVCSRHLKSVLGWTVRATRTPKQPIPRERSLTAHTILSLEMLESPAEERANPLLDDP